MKPVRILVVAALAAALSIVASPPAAQAVGTVTTWDQCDRGTPNTSCSGWITGNLNGGYSEDQVVPQRAVLDITSVGTTTFAFSYQDLTGPNLHAIDYLATWNYTQTTANPCQGIGALCSGAPATYPIPSDTSTRGSTAGGYSNVVASHELPQADRQLTLYGGATIANATVTHNSGEGILTVDINATATGDVVLLFGAHLAVTGPNTFARAWQNGASKNSGTIQFRVVTGGAATHPMKIGGAATPAQPPNFTITKTASAPTTTPGGPVTYTVTVKNTGGQPGSTTFTDTATNGVVPTFTGTTAPGGGSCTAANVCTTSTLNPGDSQVFTFNATMPTSFGGAQTCSGGYNVSNTATLAALNSDPAQNTATATVCVTAAPKFEITKTASSPTSTTGGSITYKVTVKNTGAAPGSTSFTDVATNDVKPTLTGTVPTGGTCTSGNVCTTTTLAPDASQEFTFTATMPTSFTGAMTCDGGYKVTNTATIAGVTPASVDVCVAANAGFSITKSASPTSTGVNGSVTYTVTVKNTGSATGSTTFTDTASNGVTPALTGTTPTGGTCTAANLCTTNALDPGESQVFTFSATMPGSFTGGPTCAGGYVVTNTASLTGGGSASAPVCVAAAPAFSIEKDPETQTVDAGHDASYTVTVTNTGTAPGSTTFTDDYADDATPGDLPTGCVDSSVPGNEKFTCTTPSLAPGESKDYSYSVTMPGSFSGSPGIGCLFDIGKFPVVNTVTIGTGGPSDSATVCVSTTPHLTVTKTAGSPTAGPGDTVHYTVTVANDGTGPGATTFTDDFNDDAEIVGDLPDGCTDSTVGTDRQITCDTGSIDPGTNKKFEYDLKMPTTFSGTPSGCADGGFPVVNTVTLAGDADRASAKVCVTTSPDFSIVKSTKSSTAAAGQVVDYVVTVTNNGSGPGATAFTDDYDDDAHPVVSSLPDGCTDSSAGGNKSFTCETGTLDPGEEQEFTYSVAMPVSFTSTDPTCAGGGFAVANLVSLEGGGSDDATVCVSTTPDFTIAKEATSTTAMAGDTVHYTVTISNDGTGPGSTTFTDDYNDDAVAQDPLPDGCTDSSDGDNKMFTCETGTIEPGTSVEIEYDVTMPLEFSGTPSGCDDGGFPVVNDVSLAGDAGSDSATVCVITSPNFTVTKSVDPGQTPHAGDDVAYTVTVTNHGSGPGSTIYTDDYDDDASPVLPLPEGCLDSSSGTNKKFSCDTGSIDPGATVTYKYSITMPDTFSSADATCASGGFAVVNTVTVTGSTDSATVCVATAPKFTITKAAGSTTALPGGVVHYTVKVKNTGTGPGSTSFTDDYDNDASIVSTLPAGCTDSTDGDKQLTCNTGTIDPGTSQTFEYDVTMPAEFSGTPSGCDDAAFPVVNTVTLAGDAGTDSATVCVATAPDFDIEKTAGSATADPNEAVEYTVVVTNNGSGPGSTTFTDTFDTDASLVLPLADGCTDTSTASTNQLTCETGSIDPRKTQTFHYEIAMPASFTGTSDCDGGYAVVNNVTVDEEGGSTDSASVCVQAAPDLHVTKSVDPDDPGPGDEVTYTVTVSNTGTAPGSTTVTDDYDQDHLTLGTLPEGCTDDGDVLTCETGSIEAGDEVTFEYEATITDAFTGDPDCEVDGQPGYTIVNTATIGPDNGDEVRLCVPAAPDFSITKSVDPTTGAQPGGTVHYTIVVTNSGDAAGSTGFTDNYDDRVQDIDTPTGSRGGVCSTLSDDGDALFSCVTGTVPAHSSETFGYDAVLPDSFGSVDRQCEAGGFSVSNVATLVSGGADAPAEVCVDAAPLFHVDKSVDDIHALPNQTVTYRIVVTNDGTAPGSTRFTDNYDDRLDDSITAPAGCEKSDVDGDLVLVCETGTIEPEGTQAFEYSATIPNALGGSHGDCGDDSYLIENTVTVEVSDDHDSDSAAICVPAKPHFTIAKEADDTSALPGQTIHYTVTVSNDGHVAAPTTFTDTITPALPRSHVLQGCQVNGGTMTCTTGTIEPGSSQKFEYDVTLPATYTGDSGGDGCAPGEFPVSNTATLTSGEHDGPATQPICVTAKPALHVSKSVQTSGDADSTTLTYTISYSNTGPAEARQTVLTDPIPAGTSFVSCTGGCTHGGTPDTATWNIGSLAPLTGSGSMTLVVKVTGKQACSVSNTATIDAAVVDPVSSNTVTTDVNPPTDPTGAKANGSGAGAQVLTAGLLNLLVAHNGDPIGSSSSSQTGPGGPVLDADSVASAKIPNSNASLVKVGLVNTSSASAVDGSPIAARQLSSAEVANVCLVPVGGVCTVEVTALRSVAATLANGTTTGTSSAGSSIANLKIAGLATPVDLSSTTTITLNPLIFGPGSYVAINERKSETGLKDGKLYADMTTTMIHLKISGLLGLQSAEIIVGQAKAHSEFLKTFECNPNGNSVSGHAFVAGANTGPLQTNVIQGGVGMGPKGGGNEQHLAAVVLPANGSLVSAAVADSKSVGSVTATTADSSNIAEVAGTEGGPVCVVRTSASACLVTALAVRSQATSHADTSNGSVSTAAGTTFTGLKVLGLPVDVNVAPNTTINLPGIGYVVLNEQTCDGGGLAVNGSCAGHPHSGITVRAVHVVVTVLNNTLGLKPAVEVIVAEAHADSTVF